MKKIIMLLGLMAIAGCDVQAQQSARPDVLKRYPFGDSQVYEVCIEGVVYLIFSGYHKGGITPKINAEHYPYTCNQTIK